MVRLFLILFLFSQALATKAQVLGFVLPEGKKKVEFPIEIYNNLVVLPIVLNGQLPLKFILDTGVRTAILTEKAYSDILNLPYTRKYTLAGPGGVKLVDAYVTTNVSLDIATVHGQGHALLVLDQDYLELRNSLGVDVHGILGYELFSRFAIKIDYESKTLTLYPPEKFKPGRKYKSVPISIEDTKPYITTVVSVNDSVKVSAKLLVDSGASHGLILEPDSDERLAVPEKHVNSIIGRGLGGVITGQIARIKSLDLGSYKITDVLANYPDPNSYTDTLTLKVNERVHRNGALGGEILSRFTVIFDFPRDRMYLKKNFSYNKKAYFNLSGLSVRAKGAKLRNFEITAVRENSVAEKADLKVGDSIVMLNGYEAKDLDLNSINALFNSKPGRRIVIEVERNGQRFRKEFKLQSQI